MRVLCSAVAILVFLLSGTSTALRDWAGDGTWWNVFAYFTVLYFALWVAGLPFSLVGHRLEEEGPAEDE